MLYRAARQQHARRQAQDADLSDISAFNDTMGASKHDGSISVDSSDWEGTDPNGVKFVSGTVVASIDKVVHLVVARDAALVGAEEALINLKLTRNSECKEISNIGNVNKHVATKSKGAWSLTSQGSASKCSASSQKSIVRKLNNGTYFLREKCVTLIDSV